MCRHDRRHRTSLSCLRPGAVTDPGAGGGRPADRTAVAHGDREAPDPPVLPGPAHAPEPRLPDPAGPARPGTARDAPAGCAGLGHRPDRDRPDLLAEFCDEILHQDTCRPRTADGLALLAALAVEDRVRSRPPCVPSRHRAATAPPPRRAPVAATWPAHPAACRPRQRALHRLGQKPAEAGAGVTRPTPSDRVQAPAVPGVDPYPASGLRLLPNERAGPWATPWVRSRPWPG